MSGAAIDMALLERAVSGLPADALDAVRRDAMARFMVTGFPHPKLEDWKYTNLAPAVELSNAWLRDPGLPQDVPAIDAGLRQSILAATASIDAHWLVIANGAIDGATLGQLSTGEVEGLEAWSSAQRGDTPEVFVGEPMSRFNAALLRDVLHVRIAAGTVVDKPVGVLVIDDAGSEPGVSQTRAVIDLGDNARAQFIELHVSTGGNGHFANGVIELVLASGAQADYVRLQERGAGHFQVNRLTARLARDALLNHAAFDLGGELVRNDIDVDIAEPGASVSLQGLYLAHGRQHIDNHTRIDHRVGPAKSVEEYRGILNDRARCVWNGKAIVHAGADGTDAQQTNRNLLLSAKAEIDTKPELEIYADDVKCSHGATVGQLDPNALFYLQTRGLDRTEAARALTRAFAAAVVDRIPVISARSRIEQAIHARLNTLIDGVTR